jgi:arginase family enzyme
MSDIRLLIDFLTPVDQSVITANQVLSPYQLGNTIVYFDGSTIPDTTDAKIAIVGVMDERNAVNNEGVAQAPLKIKEELYQLSAFNDFTKIIDMGFIRAGATSNDTYFGLAKVCSVLMRMGLIPIVVGGSNDLAYGQFLSYQDAEQEVNCVHADARLDLSFLQDEILSTTYLSNLFTHKPNFLKQFCLLGYQSYLVDYNLMKVLNQLSFDAIRLGALQEDWKEMEPYVRDADMVSVDMSVVRGSEAPGNCNASPNGFFGNEICALARYAGMSDRVSSFGIYEVNPRLDIRNQTTQLAAQMIWYFIDGVLSRVADYPIISDHEFYTYEVPIPSTGDTMTFKKSKKSSRWWIKVQPDSKGAHKLIPCSYKDYECAIHDQLPDRWMKGMTN